MYCDDIEIDYKFEDLTYDAILNLIRGRYPPNVSIKFKSYLYSSPKPKNLKQTRIQSFSSISMVTVETISSKSKTQRSFPPKISPKCTKK